MCVLFFGYRTTTPDLSLKSFSALIAFQWAELEQNMFDVSFYVIEQNTLIAVRVLVRKQQWRCKFRKQETPT